jgi:Ras-related protein Rab-1A
MAEYDELYKVIIVGNSFTGKSSILLKLCDNTFKEAYLTTIGVDFKIKTIAAEGKKVKLQIWDTAGQERFHTITLSYYKKAHAVVIVFDLTDINSFNSIENWVSEAQQHAPHSAKKYLIGTKSDMIEKRVVSFEDASNMAKEFKLNYVEVSSKTGSNIQEAFESMSIDLIHSIPSEEKIFPKPTPLPTPPIKLSPMNEALDQLRAKCC